MVSDRHPAVADPSLIIRRIRRGQQCVEFLEGIDNRHRNAVSAAEPAALTLDAAFLMGTARAGFAVECVETLIGAERHPPLGFLPTSADQNPGNGGLHVVFADLSSGNAAQLLEGVHMPLKKGFLTLRGEGPGHLWVPKPSSVFMASASGRRAGSWDDLGSCVCDWVS